MNLDTILICIAVLFVAVAVGIWWSTSKKNKKRNPFEDVDTDVRIPVFAPLELPREKTLKSRGSTIPPKSRTSDDIGSPQILDLNVGHAAHPAPFDDGSKGHGGKFGGAGASGGWQPVPAPQHSTPHHAPSTPSHSHSHSTPSHSHSTPSHSSPSVDHGSHSHHGHDISSSIDTSSSSHSHGSFGGGFDGGGHGGHH